jgi:hypothetical protein
MQPHRERIVWVKRRKHARFVPASSQLRRKRLYVASDATWVGPRVRRDKRNPHGLLLYL